MILLSEGTFTHSDSRKNGLEEGGKQTTTTVMRGLNISPRKVFESRISEISESLLCCKCKEDLTCRNVDHNQQITTVQSRV
jgi:hypothetical protein